MKKPYNLIVMGVQASGKGTQVEKLAEKYDLFVFETGKLLREEVKRGTVLGKELDRYMSAGKHVPNEVVDNMLKEKLSILPPERGFIIDGSPRNLEQLERLDKLLKEINREDLKVFEVKISDEEAIKRISKRFVCEKCQKNYRIEEGDDVRVCEDCGGKLIRRKDDTPEAVKIRLAVSHKDTEPVIAEYRRRGKLVEINGEQDIEAVQSDIIKQLE